ncbi:hypothetical protein [Pseudomonas sp. N2-3-1-14]|uniref:hypothetical protein n=1 Tax=Pseudomonas sp. N2-3-1-14 TaxID=3240264 RepID=UPI003512DCF7
MMRAWALLWVLAAGSSSAADAFYTWADPVPPMPGKLLRSEALTPQQSLASVGLNLRILYRELDHSGAVNGSLGDSTGFVRRAFPGEAIKGNCG